MGFKIKSEVKINGGAKGVDEIGIDFEYVFPVSVRECYDFGFRWHMPLVLSIFNTQKKDIIPEFFPDWFCFFVYSHCTNIDMMKNAQ